MGQEEHPPIALIQSSTFYFFVSTQISVPWSSLSRWREQRRDNLRSQVTGQILATDYYSPLREQGTKKVWLRPTGALPRSNLVEPANLI